MSMYKILNNEYKSEKIIRKEKEIIGYTNDSEVFKISNIDDFTKFKLKNEKNEDVEFDKSTEQILKEQNNALIKSIAKINIENKKKDAIATNLVQTIATLNLRLNKIEKEKEGK